MARTVSFQKQAVLSSYQRSIAGAGNPTRGVLLPTLVGSVLTINKLVGGSTNTKPHQYQPGDIIRYPHVEPSIDPKADLRSSCVGWTEETGPIVAKFRPGVVMQVHATQLKVIPMYSCGGRGMGLKTPAERQMCIALRSSNDFHPDWNDVPAKDYLVANMAHLSGASFIDIVRDFPVAYKYPIKKEGKLTSPSIKRLLELYEISFFTPKEGLKWATERIAAVPVFKEFEPAVAKQVDVKGKLKPAPDEDGWERVSSKKETAPGLRRQSRAVSYASAHLGNVRQQAYTASNHALLAGHKLKYCEDQSQS